MKFKQAAHCFLLIYNLCSIAPYVTFRFVLMLFVSSEHIGSTVEHSQTIGIQRRTNDRSSACVDRSIIPHNGFGCVGFVICIDQIWLAWMLKISTISFIKSTRLGGLWECVRSARSTLQMRYHQWIGKKPPCWFNNHLKLTIWIWFGFLGNFSGLTAAHQTVAEAYERYFKRSFDSLIRLPKEMWDLWKFTH